MLPLGCAAAPNGLTRSFRQIASASFTTAAQPSGSKLPRHESPLRTHLSEQNHRHIVGDSMLQGNPATVNLVGIRSDFSSGRMLPDTTCGRG
ncbi:hypothetical protein DZG01_07530 [Pseudomonas fluorescens]|nr:hypothetical protein DZG01_07530 [Pseudomonas fluorescens]